MSRLIVKNLPKKIKEERIRSVFGGKGELTDVKLCYTKDGKFRRFCFVGYKTEKQAKAALNYFDNSFIDTSKIKVDIAKDLGDESVPRPWSKYSKGSSAYDRLNKQAEGRDAMANKRTGKDKSVEKDVIDNSDKLEVVKEKRKMKSIEVLGDLEEDVEFQEFLNVHKHRTSKTTWSNENRKEENEEKKTDARGRKLKPEEITLEKYSAAELDYDDSDDSAREEETYDASGITNKKDEMVKAKAETEIAEDFTLSDMAYLKTKIVSLQSSKGNGRNSPENGNMNSDDSSKEDLDNESCDDDDDVDDDNDDETDSFKDNKKVVSGDSENVKQEKTVFGTIKMRGLPFKIKEKHIEDFFSPVHVRVVNIRLINNANGKPTGCAFVDFSSEKDMKAALTRDRDCIKGRYIELFKDEGEKPNPRKTEENPWMKKVFEQGNEEEYESIAESGRLFLRNLAYICSEEDLQQLFEKFGPLSETYLPLDKTTNKPIGIGFVTFLMPEHAVKAFNELDGKVFQGRLLHILPSKSKEAKEEVKDHVSANYKTKRDLKKKSLSGSDHNWNTLFLGMNAVADIMADRYNTTKGGILDDGSSKSLAVRMALGETQVVTETRKFLLSQGVKLDVFGQPSAKRSKTIIVVKNLPFNTSCEELRSVFMPFGSVGRIVLPPSGITALVEFFEQSQAKKAFQKLAYSKFKHVPLYLEWAPVAVFSGNPQHETGDQTETAEKTEQEKSKETLKESEVTGNTEEVSDSENSEGTTVFVKNLNFNTSEDALKEVFSKVGLIISATIAKKKDAKRPGNLLSMGYGFVEFKKRSDALQAIKLLQNTLLEDHNLQLKMSHRKSSEKGSQRKRASSKVQKNSKILVRNVPFEATKKELQELFGTFGEIKTLRLPLKMSGTGSHRGFAFVDFLTKQDAKRAFESLCGSTHLYGRRLVLEWAEDEDSLDALRKRTADHFYGTPKAAKRKKDLLDDLMDAEMRD